MYTELYLGVNLSEDMPIELVGWLKSHNEESEDWYVKTDSLAPDELKKTRLSVLAGGSYYFDAQQHFFFKYDRTSGDYFLTMGLNIKNYDHEIRKFLNILEPYIVSDGHIGHTRYEEEEYPTLLMFDKYKTKLIKYKEIE